MTNKLDHTTSTDDSDTDWIALFPSDGEIGGRWVKSNAFLPVDECR